MANVTDMSCDEVKSQGERTESSWIDAGDEQKNTEKKNEDAGNAKKEEELLDEDTIKDISAIEETMKELHERKEQLEKIAMAAKGMKAKATKNDVDIDQISTGFVECLESLDSFAEAVKEKVGPDVQTEKWQILGPGDSGTVEGSL